MTYRIKNTQSGTKLIPSDSQKSFYGKAKVREENGKQILTSYTTDVAEIENGKAKVFGLYSDTTTRHIKEFLKQNGFKAENSKQIMQDYGSEKKEENDNSFKTISSVAMLGDVFGKTLAEKNAWKKRMLKAGLGNRGLDFPEDWDKLSEKEKKKRLDKTIELMKEKK